MLGEYSKPIRKAEVEALKHWFPQNARVLDIGGGTGYQANIIASWGCRVVSIDLASRPAERQYFPVASYDGSHLPFDDCQFDVIFSSNVLDDIGRSELEPLLREMQRVCDRGVFIHILPSTAWRLWCMLAHYPDLTRSAVRRFVGKYVTASQLNDGRPHVPVRSRNPLRLMRIIRNVLIDPPQSACGNSFAELYYFSRRHWRCVFERSGFHIVEITGNGLFYSGYGLLPRLSVRTRRKLAPFLGQACTVFVLTASQ